jgi:hypothetical protein
LSNNSFVDFMTLLMPRVSISPTNPKDAANLQINVGKKGTTISTGDNHKFVVFKGDSPLKDMKLNIPVDYLGLVNTIGGKKVFTKVEEGRLFVWNDNTLVSVPSLQEQANSLGTEEFLALIKQVKSQFEFTCPAADLKRVLETAAKLIDGDEPLTVTSDGKQVTFVVKSNVGSMKEVLKADGLKGKGTTNWNISLAEDIFGRCQSDTTVTVFDAGFLAKPAIKDGELVYGASIWQA